MSIALIIGVIGLGLSLLTHVVVTVWWASRITTILEASQKSLNELLVDMKAVNKMYVSKEDYAKDNAHLEKKIDAAWVKIDYLMEKVK